MARTMGEALIEQDRKRGKKRSETQVKREMVRGNISLASMLFFLETPPESPIPWGSFQSG